MHSYLNDYTVYVLLYVTYRFIPWMILSESFYLTAPLNHLLWLSASCVKCINISLSSVCCDLVDVLNIAIKKLDFTVIRVQSSILACLNLWTSDEALCEMHQVTTQTPLPLSCESLLLKNTWTMLIVYFQVVLYTTSFDQANIAEGTSFQRSTIRVIVYYIGGD